MSLIRVWADGCFDMMHYGHANALRQAKSMGNYLIVGVHSDLEITKHKGPPVMNEEERYAAVRACKWVDEVVEDAPYNTQLSFLEKYNCDFCVHGDDITTMEDGTDCYQEVKDAGKYKECKRTQGVSTTELVGRMLLMTRTHLSANESEFGSIMDDFKGSKDIRVSQVSHFLTTSKKITQFSEMSEPKVTDKVVYVDGDFDLFHVGHIEFLKKAKELGDYLLVGVHEDQIINQIKGYNFPLLNLNERVLSVLSCRYVDEVIIGAPYKITHEVLNGVYRIDIVAHGSNKVAKDIENKDPYELPKKLGIYKEVNTEWSSLSTSEIIKRIIRQREKYEERQRRKREKSKIEEAINK